MRSLLIVVGVCVLFVVANARSIFSDLGDDEIEVEGLNDDFPSAIDKIVSVSLPICKPAVKPELDLSEILRMLDFDENKAMFKFRVFIGDAIQQMIDAVKCRAWGHLLPPRTTKGPSRPPSGSAPTGKAPTGAP